VGRKTLTQSVNSIECARCCQQAVKLRSNNIPGMM